MVDSEAVARARAVPIAHEIHRRGVMLRRVGQELIGGCPRCGGKDKFQVNVRKNIWLCRGNASGSVIDLVQHLDDVPFAEAVSRLTGGTRPAPSQRRAPTSKPGPSQDDWKRRALDLWAEAAPIAGTIAERYLRAPKVEGGRAIDLSSDLLPLDVSPRVIRFHRDCPFGEGARHPCLIALYRDVVTDAPTAIMRTALTPDGRKLDRKALGNVGGAAIKLSDDADVTMALTIGEGLETTLAGMAKGFAPAWALGNAGAIGRFPVLAGIEALTILGETDDGGANERAVRECFARWNAAGREVYRATSLIGGDMNDGLMVA
jgi:putative DNA primase/helicase